MRTTSTASRPAPAFRPPPGDVLLSMGLLAFAVAELVGLPELPRAVAAPGAIGMIVPLLWRRRWPVAVAVVVLGSLVAQSLLGVPVNAQLASLVAVLAAVYSLGAHTGLRRGVAGLAATLVLAGVTVPTNPQWAFSDFGFIIVVLGGAWGLGRIVGSRTAEAHAHEQQAALVLAHSEERTRHAREEERRRIARELHDIISHSLSLMVVQAGAAEQVLATDPDRVAEPLQTIQDTGREALTDMKRLLGLLRAPALEDGLRPQPGLAEVQALVDQIRQAGVPAVLTVEGTPAAVGDGVQLSVYRIVQEALTNVMKHASSARVHVTIRHTQSDLEVEIIDDGEAAPGTTGTASGLSNMRERTALFDGVFEAGPRPKQGFRVYARFPVASHTARP